jgi:alpha/beta superfamily hydrolase
VVNVILLAAGNFMDPSSILLIMAPILYPLATKLGVNPVHMGILMIVNTEVGMCHPPVGLNLYVASGIAKMGISEITVAVLPWLGYYTVLVDGNDLWIKGGGGNALLQGVIARAQASPHAVAGKVGVVAFSLGGAVGLTYATRLPDQVATVVVMYPLTNFIKDPADFVGKIKVPVLMLAGTADTYHSCCVIEKARALADAAKANPDVAPLFVLHEYEGADHGFNMNTSHQRALVADSRDRAIAQLRQYLVDHC